ncbi:hypothetical protein COJ07_06515 [Bacillus cereus]|uniref:hypothetical protein n=1 Tax=Bacillus cereus TaxID=1396 RepID=UPI000BF69D25|nr:hypothetical protein [Bacillus cereus]PFL23226.1 hypothetical protein COJ07_06515 [Bacillus cereus]
MNEKVQLEQLKKNILSLSLSLMDAPYRGVSKEAENAINFAITKVVEGTSITTETLIRESHEKGWFKPNKE